MPMHNSSAILAWGAQTEIMSGSWTIKYTPKPYTLRPTLRMGLFACGVEVLEDAMIPKSQGFCGWIAQGLCSLCITRFFKAELYGLGCGM